MRKTVLNILYSAIAFSIFIAPSYAASPGIFRKHRKVEKTETKQQKASRYDKLFKDAKDAVHAKGAISIHKADDKIFLEIPDSLFGKDFLVDSYVTRTSDVTALAPGLQTAPGKRIRIDRTDSLVLFRIPKYNAYPEKGSKNIANALHASQMFAISKAFPIDAWNEDSTSVVFDATSFFSGSNEDIINLKGYPFGDGYSIQSSEYVSDRSKIDSVAAYDRGAAVFSEVGLKLEIAFVLGTLSEKPEVSIGLVTTLTLLPEQRMQTREADSRMGTAYVSYTTFGEKGSREGYFAGRWNLVPRDSAAIYSGKLSDPLKPITVYVDTLFSPSWANAVREGLLKWNDAFEGAGFRNAIRVLPYPSDTSFRSDDPLTSCVEFSPSTGNSITLHRLADPRTGEIMSFKMVVPRDFAESARKDAIYSIAGTDERYAGYYISDDAICDVLAARIMQRMGSAIGLATNLAGSYAYSPEQLRDPEFTQKHGFSASVMDDVLFNSAASKSDREKGVATIISKPGEYDEFAVKWLYSPIKGDEKKILSGWLAEKVREGEYLYGRRAGTNYLVDPRSQRGDLGSDVLATIAQETENLEFVQKNAVSWLSDDDIPESYKSLFPDFLFLKIFSQARVLCSYVGGVYLADPREGDSSLAAVPVDKSLQKKMMKAVFDLCDDFSWLDSNVEFLQLGGPNENMSNLAYMNMPMMLLMPRILRMGYEEQLPGNAYSQKDALADLEGMIFKDVRSGRRLSDHRLLWAGQMISYLINASPAISMNYKLAKASRALDSACYQDVPDNLVSAGSMRPVSQIPFYSGKVNESVMLAALENVRRDLRLAESHAGSQHDRDCIHYYISLIDMALSGGKDN